MKMCYLQREYFSVLNRRKAGAPLSVKSWSRECEGLSSGSRTQTAMSGMMVCAHNPSSGKAEVGGTLGLAGQPTGGFQANERPCLSGAGQAS